MLVGEPLDIDGLVVLENTPEQLKSSKRRR
jgi:hypothetical protein